MYNSNELDGSVRTTIRTYSGVLFDPFNPSIDQIMLDDIIHSLALQCRFNGHSYYMYSVARHSIYVAELLEREKEDSTAQLCGLLHDAAEAYFGDIIAPIKNRPEMAFFRDAEEHLLSLIAQKMDLPWPFPECVWLADKAITQAETSMGRYTLDATSPVRDERDFGKLLGKLILEREAHFPQLAWHP